MSLCFYDGKGNLFASTVTFRFGWWAEQEFLKVYPEQKVALAWGKESEALTIPDAFLKKLFKKPKWDKKEFPLLKFSKFMAKNLAKINRGKNETTNMAGILYWGATDPAIYIYQNGIIAKLSINEPAAVGYYHYSALGALQYSGDGLSVMRRMCEAYTMFDNKFYQLDTKTFKITEHTVVKDAS